MMNLLRSIKGFWAGKKAIATIVGLGAYLVMCKVTATEINPEIVTAFLGSSVVFAKMGQWRANKQAKAVNSGR